MYIYIPNWSSPKEKMVGKRTEKKYLKKILSKFGENYEPQIWEAQQAPSITKGEDGEGAAAAEGYTYVLHNQVLKASDKEKILKFPKEKPHVQKNKHKDVGIFLVHKMIQTRR